MIYISYVYHIYPIFYTFFNVQTLQQNLAAKTEEARHLMQELTGAQQRLRSLRDAAAALVLGASATRNGPCRDNSFDRR